MTFKCVVRSALLCLFTLEVAWGQAPPTPADGQFTQNFGTDNVSLQNLGVGINVPVLHEPGPLPFDYQLVGLSGCFKIAGPYLQCGYTNAFPATTNYLVGNSPVSNLWTLGGSIPIQNRCAADPGSTTVARVNLYLIDPSGTVFYLPSADYVESETGGSSCVHTLNDLTLTGSIAVVADSSGTITSLTFPNGSIYNTSGSTLKDTFGNQIKEDISGNFYSTLSTTVPAMTASGYVDTYNDTTGTPQQISQTITNETQKTVFNCSGKYDQTIPNGNFVTSVNFPDGHDIGIQYEAVTGGVTGRVSQITLRTGGIINYQYGTINCTNLIPSSITRTDADGARTYTWAMNGTHGTMTTVLDPGANKTVYMFQGTDANGLPIIGTPLTLTQVQVYQNTGTVGAPAYTLLSTTLYCYNGNATNCATTQAAYPITEKDTYFTPGSKTTSSRVSQTFDSYGNVTSSARYDYGASSFDNETTTTYGSWNGSTCVSVGSNIVNVPCDVVIMDNASHKIAETRYTYNSQGFNTQIQNWTGSTWLTSSATPNANGTVATSTALNGQVTNYSYAATGSGGCHSLLVTGTSTIVNGVTLTSGKTWDCNTGLVLSSTGANSDATQYTYDAMLRPTSVTDPITFTVNESYPTSNKVSMSWSMNGASSSTTTTVDGLGRPIRTQTTHGSNYDTKSTGYISANPYAYVENEQPCLTLLGQDCTFSSYHYVDALGRKIEDQDGNGGIVSVAYNQNDVQTTLSPPPSGEHAKVSQIEYDGLGRVKSTCAIQNSGGTACGQVDGGSGVPTAFAYSTSSGSQTLTGTRGVQTHTTVTDALGRTTSETYPESGTTTYSYDSSAGSACNNWAGAPGKLMLISRANGTRVCFNYADPLGRPTDSEGFGSTNTCKRYRYDAPSNGIFTAPGTVSNVAGRLVEAETDNCSVSPPTAASLLTDEWFSYDADGRMTDVWEKTLHSGGYYHTTATYYANGAVASISGIPNYAAITYGIDANGRLNSASLGSTSLVSSVTRTASGSPSLISIAGGDTDSYTYDPNTGRMTNWTFTVGATPKYQSGTLTWNPNGTLQTLAIADTYSNRDIQTCTFSYDDLSRLVSDNCGSVWAQTFSFDQYDNLTKSGSVAWVPGYNQSNNHYQNGSTYDASGNVTYDSTNWYWWDAFGKRAGDSTTNSLACGSVGYCYIYDALGRAVEIQGSTGTNEWVLDPVGDRIIEMDGPTLTDYAFIPTPGGGRVQTWSNGSVQVYEHMDWLGSDRFGHYIDGRVVNYDHAYAPYGESYAYFGGGNQNGYMFAGIPSDPNATRSLGLFETPNRELSPGQSRWLSPDPAHAGWNLYAYPTNPNSMTDPSGLDPINFLCLMKGKSCDTHPVAPYPDVSGDTGLFAEGSEWNSWFLAGELPGQIYGPGGGDFVLQSSWTTYVDYGDGNGPVPLGRTFQYVPAVNNSPSFLDLLNGASNVPWIFNFIASTPEEPIGPALTIAYHPSNKQLFVGLGLGISEGKNASFGPVYPLPGTNSGQIDNVLSGGSWSWGYNWPNLAGVQVTGNFSGSMGGATMGVPGAGAEATYSLQIDLQQAYEFLLEHF